MRRKLQTYESQATVSVILAGAAAVFVMGAAFCALYKFDWKVFMLSYNSGGMRLPVLGGSLFLALAASVVGFFVAFNSAGQRRNKKSRLSWIGFFANAALIALALMIGFFFLFTRFFGFFCL